MKPTATISAADDMRVLRQRIRAQRLADEAECIGVLVRDLGLSAGQRREIAARAAALVRRLRESSSPELMESFLAQYGLSTREGIALMCLAEALLRVPDSETIDVLIADKIAPSDWGRHLGKATSSLVNASTWALMLTGQILSEEEEGIAGVLHAMVRRLGEPVVRTAVSQAMREMGHQFVLGRTIEEALDRAAGMHAKGYTYSYDMLGEAARTAADARRYHLAYSDAIASLAPSCVHPSIRDNPGISVKLSALHERYEFAQRERVMKELVARARSLAVLAQSANMGFNIDAEEADRLDLSLDVIEAVVSDSALAGWDGFGVVVQAYGQRAPHVLDWLYALATRLDRRLMVRLVKGAYWDTEIKRAQVDGLAGFPVFTRKASTDVSYLACVRRLLAMTDRIYPQFATHNAHTVSAVIAMATDHEGFEFQRLHGMGETLHEMVREREGTRCRIYAPVGAHRDLLAYLVRRLLENGANSSFVNQIVDTRIAPEVVAADPVAALGALADAIVNPVVTLPSRIHGPHRLAARGFDLTDPVTVSALDRQRARFRESEWQAAPPVPGDDAAARAQAVTSPGDLRDRVGTVIAASEGDVDHALSRAVTAQNGWAGRAVQARAACLERIADGYEANAAELFALLAREAGKTLPDAVAELREAVDFCRYYACEARRGAPASALGTFACISPWNFPLAIFTGQIVAALVTGNCVIAKPAEQTPLVAAWAVRLMHEAGVPEEVIQLLPGDGPTVGARLVADPRVAGVCFTGSTATARSIHSAMAASLDAGAPLIAETGGLNAMVVDSTALPEQAVRDIIASAFQSAGQRCSALRVLYVQKDVEDRLLTMLTGAMDALVIGDPWRRSTDVGPVIDDEARLRIEAHCKRLDDAHRCIKRRALPDDLPLGRFVAPAVYRLDSIAELEEEIFGPVLHVVSFEAEELQAVIDAINATGYGLTFGMHTRVDGRVQEIMDRIHCGNIYVNRNQIGAVVGVQPFGGEGLSGTGPKAGGPHYLARFQRWHEPPARPAPGAASPNGESLRAAVRAMDLERWQADGERRARLDALLEALEPLDDARDALDCAARVTLGVIDLPGPTGESNRLSLHPRGVFVCLDDVDGTRAMAFALQALALGCGALVVAPNASRFARPQAGIGAALALRDGTLDANALETLPGIAGVAASVDADRMRALRRALAARPGPILPLISSLETPVGFLHERVLSIDTTAAGGNAALLVEAADAAQSEA